ncbi:hypothetical protein [Mucilaginibacter sp.]|uniref:hypothetical protein n=1 Tax=Mucilaginibacter sp. TaxID=1882438 RepID=UPI0025F2844B|nr:hypothetical protein [Mucilaginibacter sp.]
MPHEWNNKIVVTKGELVPNWFSSHNLRTTIDRLKGKYNEIIVLQRGGNGRIALYDFDSLPTQIQHGLGDPRKVKHVLEQYYRTDNEAVAFFTKHRLSTGNYLTADYQDKYIINASVLKALIALRAAIEKERKKKGINTTGITAVLCEHAITFQKTLQVRFKDEHTLPESLKRFKEVLKAFEKNGYKSLISGKHGNDNSRKVYENTIALLESMFAKDTTKPTATEVHRRYDAFLAGHLEIINNESGEVYSPVDFKELSVATVTKYLSDWISQIATHANRSGDNQKYMQSFKPHHSLDKPKFAGSIISIDDRQPPFKTHNGKRIWFYNGIDLGSEAFTCWVYGNTKEDLILKFYRQMIRNYAEWGFCLPNELEAEMSLNSSFVNTFLREGAMFQDVRIEANNARGKRIEAYYKPLRYQLEKKREGWLARPFALSESNQSGSHEVPTLHPDDIIEGCLIDLETWNNMPHSVHTHLTRWEVFEQMQHPDLKPINYNAFMPYLGYKTKTSCNVGIIRLQGGEYLLGENGEVCAGENLINLMSRVEGKDIDVYWLDDNAGNILKALVYIGDLLICEAVSKPTYNRAKIEQGPNDIANREIMSKYVMTIEAFGKRRKREIEAVTQIDNTPQRPKSFVMPGLKRNSIQEGTPLPDLLQDTTNVDFVNVPQNGFVRPLNDTF